MNYICDCGQHYRNRDALAACQAAAHSAAPGIELADALRAARLAGAEPPHDLPDQLSPSRDRDIPRPSVLEVLRACRPSRELVGLLSREARRLATEGNTDDASALVALALCVREVVPR